MMLLIMVHGLPARSCPYLILSGSQDVPTNFLELYYDPEYTLFSGCQCDQVQKPLRAGVPLSNTMQTNDCICFLNGSEF